MLLPKDPMGFPPLEGPPLEGPPGGLWAIMGASLDWTYRAYEAFGNNMPQEIFRRLAIASDFHEATFVQ